MICDTFAFKWVFKGCFGQHDYNVDVAWIGYSEPPFIM